MLRHQVPAHRLPAALPRLLRSPLFVVVIPQRVDRLRGRPLEVIPFWVGWPLEGGELRVVELVPLQGQGVLRAATVLEHVVVELGGGVQSQASGALHAGRGVHHQLARLEKLQLGC